MVLTSSESGSVKLFFHVAFKMQYLCVHGNDDGKYQGQ